MPCGKVRAVLRPSYSWCGYTAHACSCQLPTAEKACEHAQKHDAHPRPTLSLDEADGIA
jgi:hypothetical protein